MIEAMDDLGMRTSIPARVHNVTWETSSWTMVPTNVLPSSSETDTVGGAVETLTVTAAFACPLAPCATRLKVVVAFTVVLAEPLGGCVPTPLSIVT